MPIPCQGLTVRWDNRTLSEVQQIDFSLDRGLPIGRTVTWTPNFGSIELASFSSAVMEPIEWGRRRRLVVEGRTASSMSAPVFTFFDRDCIYENTRIQMLANDAMRFAYTFRVQDTVGAPTNP